MYTAAAANRPFFLFKIFGTGGCGGRAGPPGAGLRGGTQGGAGFREVEFHDPETRGAAFRCFSWHHRATRQAPVIVSVRAAPGRAGRCA